MEYPGLGRGAHNIGNENAQWNHVKVFKQNNKQPYICDHCLHVVLDEDLIVHHRDDNHGNDEPSNLGAMHRGCHTTHHKKNKPLSEQARYNLSVAHVGNKAANRKLSDKDVIKLRQMYSTGDWTQKRLGELFQVSQGTIGCAIRGDLYSWVR